VSKHIWRDACIRLIPLGLFATAGAVVSAMYGKGRTGSEDHKLIALSGVLVFVLLSVTFIHTLTNIIRGLMSKHRYHLAARQAGAVRFVLRIVGYLTILLTTLELMGVSVARLLLGSAVLGIILGVAAQQALANFFASIVLVIAHPFSVGEYISINSGALGGKYTGTVIDIGLTHTRLQEVTGNVVLLPNATLLSAAAFMPGDHAAQPKA
jgi:small-conductance mechanosensitive channel